MRQRSILLVLLLAVGLERPAVPCTVFLAARGKTVLAGNNEDWIDKHTRITFHPADEASFGRVYFGFQDGFPQGGMNDQGLFFDGLALEEPSEAVPGRTPFTGLLMDRAMRECATVAEVVALFEQYDFPVLAKAQLFFGDAAGDAAIIERGAIIRKRGAYQVATNFKQSLTKPADATCPRYRRANAILKAREALSVGVMKEVLDAVHQEITVYSNVYDLVNRDVYLYLEHDFANVAKFNLDEQLAKGERTLDLPVFFLELQQASGK